MGSYPTGTITLLFADIEGSTRLLQRLQGRFADLLDAYRRTLRDTFTSRGGHAVDVEGDGYFAVFSRAGDALNGAVAAQEAIAGCTWPDNVAVRVRMALHTGEPQLVERNYVGIDVHRAARLCAAAHGGQIILSQPTRELLSNTLPRGVQLQDLGAHDLKDFGETRIFQVVAPGLRAEFPPLRSADALHDMLAQVRRSLGRREGLAPAPAAPATPVIGREQELATAGAMLLAQDVRLVTLTGPPGIGKTRVALEVARALQSHFQATAFVDLSPITDSQLVLYAVASALGLREAGAGLLADRLAEHLSDRALLLVLDNFEHVVDAAPSVGHLLEAAPRMKVLVTSRERLRLTWEREFPVPPLAMPDRGQVVNLDAMARVPAVALFLERARAVRTDFVLTPENAPAVAEICVRLGGLPLAIELCAPRVKVLSPSEISARLQRQLDLLTGGPRDLPPRQRTLRAAIASSEGLLSAGDRMLLRRLGVFVGGWTLEAAYAVCAGDADLDVLDGTASLIDKSLIRQVAQPDGAVRFSVLEAIREYALEQLERPGELEALGERHARYFSSCARQVEALLLDSRGEVSVLGLSQDRDNVLAAIEWASGRRDGETALAAASGLAWLWYMRGHLSEGSTWIDRLLTAGLPASDAVTMAVLIPAGALAWSRGQFDLATARLDEALRLATTAGDQRTEAMALACLGNLARSQGDCPRARDLHQRSLALYEQIGNQRGLAWALYDLALDARALKDHDEARRLLEDSLRLFEQQDYRWAIAWASWHLGHLALGAGDAHGAAECYGRSLALYRGIEDGRGVAQAVEGLGSVAAARQDLDGAARLLGGADVLRTSLGAPRDPVEQAPYDAQLGSLRSALGDRRFRALWEEGQRLSMTTLVEAAQRVAIRGEAAPLRGGKPLTAREQQVAVLVARGLSNREIAGALRVTERTAVSHIEHIMNKLAVNSRAQIAVWAVRHGLEPAET